MKKKIGHYLILETLGKGAMSEVYLAQDQEADKKIALKKLSGFSSENKNESLVRFKKEAHTLSLISHPGVQKCSEFFQEKDSFYLAMEYFEGKNLKYSSHLFNLREKIEIILKISEILEYIHQKGIIHRDLKPENILVKKEKKEIQVKMIDFGLAYLNDFSTLFRQGQGIGTFSYISPEQTGLLRRNIDQRSDLYSLGIMAYELLTGELPFKDKSISALIHKHLAVIPQSPVLINEEIPPVIEKIILKLLEKEPDGRYQSAEGLKKDLEFYLSDSSKELNQLGLNDKTSGIQFQFKAVGRDEELAELEKIYEKTLKNNFQMCILAGKSGAGKSKIMESFRENHFSRSTLYLFSKCAQNTSNIPYYSLIEWIKSFEKYLNFQNKTFLSFFSQEEKQKIISLSKIVPELFYTENNFEKSQEEFYSEVEKSEIFQAFTALLDIISAKEESIVLLIDDIQWADQETLNSFDYFLSAWQKKKILLLGTLRDEKKDLLDPFMKYNNFYVLPIFYFNRSKIKELCKKILSSDFEMEEEFYQMIEKNTFGSPFYIQEILKNLFQNQILYKNGTPEWKINNQKFKNYQFIQDSAEIAFHRLEVFSEQEKKILAAAAVMGKNFHSGALYEILKILHFENLEKENFISLLDKAKQEMILQDQFLIGEGYYSFVHDKIVEMFNKTIDEKERKKIHSSIAFYLENSRQEKIQSSIYELAYHYDFTDNQEKKDYYNRLAYQKALSQYAFPDTVYYMKKIEKNFDYTASFTEESLEFVIFLCKIMQQIGEIKESLYYLEKIKEKIQKFSSEKLKIDYSLQSGIAYYYMNDNVSALQFFNQSLILSEKTGKEIKNGIPYRLIGSSFWFSGFMKKAEYYFSKAIKYTPKDSLDELLPIHGLRGWSFVLLGEIEKAKKDIGEIEKHITKITHPMILAQLYHSAAVSLIWGEIDIQKGYNYALKAYEYAEKIHYTVFQYSSLASRFFGEIYLEDFEKADKTFHKISEFSEEYKINIGINLMLAWQAESFFRRKNFSKSVQLAEKIYQKEAADKIAQILSLRILAIESYRSKDLTQLEKIIEKGLEVFQESGILMEGACFMVLKKLLLEKKGESSQEIDDLIKSYKKENKGSDVFFNRAYKLLQLIQEEKLPDTSSMSLFKENLQLENIIKISQMVAAIFDLDKLLEAIVEKTLEITGAERGFLFLYQKDRPLECQVKKGCSSKGFPPIFDLILQFVEKNKKGILFSSETGFSEKIEIKDWDQSKIVSMISIPLLFNETLIGILYLDSRLLKSLFTKEDFKILQVFTAQAAISIVNAERTSIIRKQFFNLVEIISSLISNASSRIYNRTQQTAVFSELISQKIGFSQEETENVRIAALLHDLGMIGVLEKLVYERNFLSETEKKILESHPEKSVELIQELYGSETIKKIILQHHERFDGSGYPLGLKGKEIETGARIIALADDFSELLEKRDFQTLDKKEKIIQTLREGKNTFYDPEITEVLIQLIDEKNLVYLADEKDIFYQETPDGFFWEIPSNIYFEPIIVSKIIEKAEPFLEDAEILFSIDYSLAEVIRNAIVHGNKYNEKKKVKIYFSPVKSSSGVSLIFRILDEGSGMNIKEHNLFSESRRELFSVIQKLKEYNQKESPASLLHSIYKDLNLFKEKYYSDFNTFRQLEEGIELTGGVGLLYVKKTFDNIDFKNIFIGNKICGTEVIMEKKIEDSLKNQ